MTVAVISGERIWMELKKILAGRFAVPIMKVILEVGIAKHIGEFLMLNK